MRVALDTNLLAYAEGVNADGRTEASRRLLQVLPQATVVIPVQALGELFVVLVRKGGRSRTAARDAIQAWTDAFAVADTAATTLARAADLAADHHLALWDAIMMAAAAEAGCRLLLSEDLQDGFCWSGVTVANPFAPAPHPLLASLMAGGAPR